MAARIVRETARCVECRGLHPKQTDCCQDPLSSSGRYRRSARWQMRQAKPAMLTVAEVDMRASFGSRLSMAIDKNERSNRGGAATPWYSSLLSFCGRALLAFAWDAERPLATPSAQGSRALDRDRDAISAVGRQSIAGSSAGNRTVPSKKTPRGECPIAALSPSRVTDEANFGWRCWRPGCPRMRCGSGAGGVAQIAPGIDAFTRHTGLQRQQDPLVRLKLKKLHPLRTVQRTWRARWRSEPRVSRRR